MPQVVDGRITPPGSEHIQKLNKIAQSPAKTLDELAKNQSDMASAMLAINHYCDGMQSAIGHLLRLVKQPSGG